MKQYILILLAVFFVGCQSTPTQNTPTTPTAPDPGDDNMTMPVDPGDDNMTMPLQPAPFVQCELAIFELNTNSTLCSGLATSMADHPEAYQVSGLSYFVDYAYSNGINNTNTTLAILDTYHDDFNFTATRTLLDYDEFTSTPSLHGDQIYTLMTTLGFNPTKCKIPNNHSVNLKQAYLTCSTNDNIKYISVSYSGFLNNAYVNTSIIGNSSQVIITGVGNTDDTFGHDTDEVDKCLDLQKCIIVSTYSADPEVNEDGIRSFERITGDSLGSCDKYAALDLCFAMPGDWRIFTDQNRGFRGSSLATPALAGVIDFLTRLYPGVNPNGTTENLIPLLRHSCSRDIEVYLTLIYESADKNCIVNLELLFNDDGTFVSEVTGIATNSSSSLSGSLYGLASLDGVAWTDRFGRDFNLNLPVSTFTPHQVATNYLDYELSLLSNNGNIYGSKIIKTNQVLSYGLSFAANAFIDGTYGTDNYALGDSAGLLLGLNTKLSSSTDLAFNVEYGNMLESAYNSVIHGYTGYSSEVALTYVNSNTSLRLKINSGSNGIIDFGEVPLNYTGEPQMDLNLSYAW